MEVDNSQAVQAKLVSELQAIRKQLERLERRVDALVDAGGEKGARVATYVEGLDEALGGGIPSGHVVLLAGPAGTMKSSLALYMLQKNRESGGKALYITLEESRQSLLKTMTELGIGSDEDFIVDIGKLRIEHESAEEPRNWMQIFKDYLSRRLEKGKLDMLIVDPLNSLYALEGIKNPRKDLFHFFTFLRGIGVTSFLIVEVENAEQRFPNHEDYLADGVLTLDFSGDETGGQKLLFRCMKMRHTKHSRVCMALSFEKGKFLASPYGAQAER